MIAPDLHTNRQRALDGQPTGTLHHHDNLRRSAVCSRAGRVPISNDTALKGLNQDVWHQATQGRSHPSRLPEPGLLPAPWPLRRSQTEPSRSEAPNQIPPPDRLGTHGYRLGAGRRCQVVVVSLERHAPKAEPHGEVVEFRDGLVADKVCPAAAPPGPDGLVHQNGHDKMPAGRSGLIPAGAVLAIVAAGMTPGGTLRRWATQQGTTR